MSAGARILVASDSATNATLVKRLLQEEFDDVSLSTEPDRAAPDFEQCRPAVLVLAFDALQKAERYCFGLYRSSAAAPAIAHRTIVLCDKGDLMQTYQLCRKELFDDYVLFWPMNHDAPRLRMAVHQALRQLAGAGSLNPLFMEQLQRLAGLEDTVDRLLGDGKQRIVALEDALQAAKGNIAEALERLTHKLADKQRAGMAEAAGMALYSDLQRLQSEALEQALSGMASALPQLRQWTDDFGTQLAPHCEAAKAMQSQAKAEHPCILVVDDDPFQLTLVERMLSDQPYALGFASSGMQALASFRKRRPSLVLLDFHLPDQDGIETIRSIKGSEELADIPVIMMTGHSERDIVLQSRQAGAMDFVVKPLEKARLLEKIRAALQA